MNSTNRNAAAEARGVPETDQLGGKVNRENSLGTESRQPRRGGRRSRDKGNRVEREIVGLHLEVSVHAERYPLSGASRFRGSHHDIDLYPFGTDEGPLVAEVKARRSGAGFVTLEKWLGGYDCLFLCRNGAQAMVILPWGVWAALLTRVCR